MKFGAPGSFGSQLKALREAAGYTQEELAAMAGLSVRAVSSLERGERRRPQVETVRALSAALELTAAARDALVAKARGPARDAAVDELSGVSLPLPLTVLLGRDDEMRTLRQWLADPAVRLLTLIGPGGVGKTRLALEIARAIAEEGATRVVFAPLAAIQDHGLAACAIAEALGLADISAADLPRRARAASEGCPTLLVLDNLEQVPDAAPLVAELLTSAPAIRLVVTSRAPLRVRGEQEYTVGPLELEAASDAMSLTELARVPAVRLFVDRVRDGQPNFQLTAENGPTVVAICRRLDALPLALELAAPWLKVLTAEELLRRLTDDVLLSSVGRRDLPERQQTMNATVAWSFQLLNPEQQRAFGRLGALPGRFPIGAAAAVLANRDDPSPSCDEALVAVAGLIDMSLLLPAESSVADRRLYRMLETVRAYAARELTASGDRVDALQGLARYCTSEASLAEEGLVGLAQAEWLNRLHDDLESYRSALAWLIERGRSREATQIASGLTWFWAIRGHVTEGLRWYEQILNLPALPPDVEARALLGAVLMWYAKGELVRARTGLNRAVALAQGVGDMKMVAHAENLFGRVEQASGDVNAARERFAHSVERYRALAIPWGTGSALTGMAAFALATGAVGEAERLLEEARSELQYAGPWFLSLWLNLRAFLAVRHGNPDTAIALVGETLARIRVLHDKFSFVHAMVPFAAAAALKGDHAWAARILGARDAVIERTGATVVDRSVHDLCEQTERVVRARLGPERWARAHAAGRNASIDSLLKDLDSHSRRPQVTPPSVPDTAHDRTAAIDT